MTDNNKLKIALTFDDAPSINENKIKFSPDRMDKIIMILKRHNINNCTAFVVGRDAIGNEKNLELWLESGFKLANHTFSHDRCSQLSNSEFKKTISDCHTILESVGAFSESEEQWFRFPYLDRGNDISQRSTFRTILRDLGYQVAHASMDFHDDQYEIALQDSLELSSNKNSIQVKNRYISNVIKTIFFLRDQCNKHFGYNINHIAYAHFGLVSEQLLDDLLKSLNKFEIDWCDMSDVATDQVYTQFDDANASNGLILNTIDMQSYLIKILRKLYRLSKRTRIIGHSKFGPKWPYLE